MVAGHAITSRGRQKKMAVNSYQQPKAPRGTESRLHKMVAAVDKSRHWKAKVSEAAVLFRLVIHGFHPFGSVFDGDKTDWLVEVPNKGTKKVQVKWAAEQAHGRPTIRLWCRNGHSGTRLYKKGEFDIVVAYDYFTDIAYVWTWDEVKGIGTKAISDDAAEAWYKMEM